MGLRIVNSAMAIGLVAIAAVPAQASVKAGIDAWQRGDSARAIAIWRGLAEKGDSDAAFNLGQAYRLGRGVAADSGQAKKWFERAARAGHLDAQVSLGLLLFDSGSRREGLDWLERAAERGEPRALLVVGTALFNGDDLPPDPVKGYAYVSRAAAQGLPPAKETLAEMDRVMPLSQRQKGVAMAQQAARPGKPATKTPSKAAATPKASVSAPVAAAKTTAVAAARGVWRIQLGAFSSKANAQSLYARLQGKLGGAQAFYVPVGEMTRLQAGPFESRAFASAACARLKPQPCFALEAR
ncbi:SPOR domain-containing protein [Sphingomonas sp. HDW15A]|uniref:SPOR domain-containing protein n=1 Tax=Sphingomonas sp. HDW15A TaxID=2714942 RepID=UPI001F10F538|nr:SPOR domain-containing protein [Sphingomonas sp. HDW15A]